MSIFNRKAKRRSVPAPKSDHIKFKGGLDTETPRWDVAPGLLRQAQNYEIGITDGYQDISGYERYDGRPKPSDAIYSILDVTISGSFSAGDTVTQLVSGAQAVVIAVVTSETPVYLVLTKITGTFNATNALQVSAVTQGTAASLARASGASSSQMNAQYTNLAADAYRSDIGDVGGAACSGSVLGITRLDDVKYAFRNNVGGTAALLFSSSASGWTAVPLGFEMPFTSGGTYEVMDGDTITGQTSLNTAVVTRVVLESGSWAGGDAAGRFIYASQSGPFTAAELLDVGGNANVATVTANGTAITLLPNGSYEFYIEQFGGEAGQKRIYGVDGVNRGFEFDGTVFVPITTGMTVDTPTHVIVHKSHLFYAFGGSAQHSGVGTPYIWTPLFGAGELATGDTITGFMQEPGAEGGATLGIYNRNNTHMLYGSSSADWNLVKYRQELGAFPRTIQQLGLTVFQDDRGITNLHTVQAYGNFQHATLSRHIQSHFNERKVLVVASCIARDKNQYRIFYSDGSAYYITMDGKKIKGIMPMLLSHPVSCIYSLEANNGSEEIYFGSTDGYVYEMEKGTSFDGNDIEGFMIFQFTFSRYLRWIKKYLGITLEVEGEGYSEFNFAYELGYNAPDIPQPETDTKVVDFSSVFWDAFVWDAFVWDGQTLAPSTNKLRGSAENISLVIRRQSDYFARLKMSGALIRFQLRRMLRE